MTEHFKREMSQLKSSLLELSGIVESQVSRAVKSIHERDPELASDVQGRDGEIDQIEVRVEEECLKIMALYQPVAVDLRFIVAALKINNDLERIGDLACNIASRSEKLAQLPEAPIPFDLTGMAKLAQQMLHDCLDALVRSDVQLAKQTMKSDDIIDRLNRDAYETIKQRIVKSPDQIDAMILYLGVSRQLERIADHATNISEDVIYMISGEIVRHNPTDAARV